MPKSYVPLCSSGPSIRFAIAFISAGKKGSRKDVKRRAHRHRFRGAKQASGNFEPGYSPRLYSNPSADLARSSTTALPIPVELSQREVAPGKVSGSQKSTLARYRLFVSGLKVRQREGFCRRGVFMKSRHKGSAAKSRNENEVADRRENVISR